MEGVDEAAACPQLNISSLLHRRQTATPSLLYKMQSNLCSTDLKAPLPPSCARHHATHSSEYAKACPLLAGCQDLMFGEEFHPSLYETGFQNQLLVTSLILGFNPLNAESMNIFSWLQAAVEH